MNTTRTLLATSVTVTYTMKITQDCGPDLSFLESIRGDNLHMTDEEFEIFASANRKMMERYNRGEWWMVGVSCRAEIAVRRNYSDGDVFQNSYKLQSMGVWGIMSTDTDEVRAVYEEQKAQLQDDINIICATLSAQEAAKMKESKT